MPESVLLVLWFFFRIGPKPTFPQPPTSPILLQELWVRHHAPMLFFRKQKTVVGWWVLLLWWLLSDVSWSWCLQGCCFVHKPIQKSSIPHEVFHNILSLAEDGRAEKMENGFFHFNHKYFETFSYWKKFSLIFSVFKQKTCATRLIFFFVREMYISCV